MKNFEQFGVQELNAVEMREINGGGLGKLLKKIGNAIADAAEWVAFKHPFLF